MQEAPNGPEDATHPQQSEHALTQEAASSGSETVREPSALELQFGSESVMQEVAALFDKHGLALTNFQSEGSYVYFEASTPDGDITAELTFRRTEGAEGSEPGVQPGQPEETGEQE